MVYGLLMSQGPYFLLYKHHFNEFIQKRTKEIACILRWR